MKNSTTITVIIVVAAIAALIFFYEPFNFSISGQAINRTCIRAGGSALAGPCCVNLVAQNGMCVRAPVKQVCVKEGASVGSGRCCAGLAAVGGKCISVAKVWNSTKMTVHQKCKALGGTWVSGSGVCIK